MGSNLATDEERVERWAKAINSFVGVVPSDNYQIVPNKLYEKKKHKLSEFSTITGIERHLRRKGLKNLDVKKINGYEWKIGDGTQHILRRISKGKIRIIFSYIEDEPLVNTKIPIFYLHTVFMRSEGYEKNLKKFEKIVEKDYTLSPKEDISKITPAKVFHESWKNKEMAPYATIDRNEYDELKELMDNSEMAILPTMDQINAISKRTRPLFINGQAGTGKTTGISWILSLLIPDYIRAEEEQKNRILVTSMTEPVVEKLQNNTNKLLELKCKTISQTFGIDSNDIMSYLMDAKLAEGKWLEKTGELDDENEEPSQNYSPNLTFRSFRKLLKDILKKSLRHVNDDLRKLNYLVDRKNNGNCDITFNPEDSTSVKNRNRTCEYCEDNPSFHLDFEHASELEQKKQRLRQTMLRKVKNCIPLVEEEQIISFNRFRYDFFRPRKDNYDALNSEFAWYGIRTLIKGYAIKNDYLPLQEQKFLNYIKDGTIKDFNEEHVNTLFKCYKDYCGWLEDEKVLDYMDVAIYAAYVTHIYSEKIIQNRFEDIFLDEAQDLTHVEYQVLLSCLNKSSDKIVLAGDPLQTINPTGFDWDRIKAMMYEKFKESQDDPEVLSHNWRTPKDIVDVSNGILELRAKVLQGEKVNFQISNEVGSKPKLIYISDETRLELVKQLVTEKSNFKLLTRQSDEDGINQLLKEDKYLDYDELKDKNNMYSVTEIKGDEAENIILYRCGELDSEVANILINDKLNPDGLQQAKVLKIKYIINQLYILTTRSTSRMFVIESDKHKSRLWEKLFPDTFEIENDSNEGIDDILNVVSKDFDLGIYVKEQLKSYEDTFEPKFLRRALDAIGDFERTKGHQLPKSVTADKNRIEAIQYEINGDFESAGDAYLKFNAREKAFNAFVKSKSWEKVISTGYHVAKKYHYIFFMLSSPEKFELLKLDKLVEQVNSLLKEIPKWFRDSEGNIIQTLMDIVSNSKIKNLVNQNLYSLIDVFNRCNVEVDFKKFLLALEELIETKDYTNSKKLIKSFSKISKLKTKLLEYEFKILESEFKDNPQLDTNLPLLEWIVKNKNSVSPQTKLNKEVVFRQALLFIAVKKNLEGENKLISKVELEAAIGGEYRATLATPLVESISMEGEFIKSLLVLFGFDMIEFEDLPLFETLQNIISDKSKPKTLRGLIVPPEFLEIASSEKFKENATERIRQYMEKDVEFKYYGVGSNSTKNLLNVGISDKDWFDNFFNTLRNQRIRNIDNNVFKLWHDWFVANRIADEIKNADKNCFVEIFKRKHNLQCFIDLSTQNIHLMELIQNEESYQILLKTDGNNHTQNDLNNLYDYFSSIPDRINHILIHLPDKVNEEIEKIDILELDELVTSISLLMKDSKLELEQEEKLCKKLGETQKVWRLKDKLSPEIVGNLVDMFIRFETSHEFATFLRLSYGEEIEDFLEHYSEYEIEDDFNSRAVNAIKNHTREIINLINAEILQNTALPNLTKRWDNLINDDETNKCIKELSCVIDLHSKLKVGGKNQRIELGDDFDSAFLSLREEFIESYR